jgi:hypothetical protein
MGYTHYFRKTHENREDSRMFDMFGQGVRTIIEYATKYDGIQIADGQGEHLDKWEVTDELIRFNGYGEDSHETFYWVPDGGELNFCKTAHKPYDTVVTACLLHLKDVYGDSVSIGSNGGWSDWKDGATLYRNATGLTASTPFETVTA